MRTDILEKKQQILQWIKENKSKAFICQQLQCKPETLNSYLEKMNIEYKGQQTWNKGQQVDTNYIPASEYIKKDLVKSPVLRQKLIREGIKKNECEICGLSIWQGKMLPLELHHKDGNHFNNNFDNLQILCPNCHSIQEGNSGASIGKYNITPESTVDKMVNTNKKNKCVDCGKTISYGSTRCVDCYHKFTRIDKYEENKHTMRNTGNIVDRAELKQLIRTKPFLQIGQQFGVSDNAVRKWCDRFGLPRRASDIKKISDEDWEKI